MPLNLVVIDAKTKSYSIYENRELKAKFTSEHLLYPSEVEELRTGLWDGEDPEGDLIA